MGACAALLLALLVPAGAGAATPVVDSLTAVPATVAPGGLVALAVEAHDPDCPATCTTGCGLYVRADLTVWSADGGVFESESNGTSASPYSASADWRAPATEGTYTVTVSLSDSGTFLCSGRQTTTADISILVTTSTNAAPAVTALTASPGSVYTGQAAQLACTAEDPDGDFITFDWSTDLGTVTAGPAAGGTAAAALESDRPGIASVTCTATDPSGAVGSRSVLVAVGDALAERSLTGGVSVPHRLAVDDYGDVYVVDRSRTAIQVVNLFSGEPVYRLELPGVTSVAVDWANNLLIGTVDGARVSDRAGGKLFDLEVEPRVGAVADVAVDPAAQRYVTLHRTSGRVIVHDATGNRLAAFGSVGDGPGQLLSPGGVAVNPLGEIVVADSGHGTIHVFDPLTGTLLRTFAALGGGVGEFVRLDDVEVGPDGIVWASDSFQDWVQGFDPDGSPRQVVGTFGGGLGELKTAAGVAVSGTFQRLLAASANSGTVQVFRTGVDPAAEPAPQLSFAPDALLFGPQRMGTSSAPRRITVTNPGDAPLGVRNVATVGDFSLTSACPKFLDPGQTCTVSVVFTPTALGLRNGSLRLDTSATTAGGGPVQVPLSGTAFLPGRLAAFPPALAFADQPVGTMSPAEQIVLSNPGTAEVALGTFSIAGPFGHTHSCPPSLAGGASCTVSVYFTPRGIGDHLSGELTLSGGGATLRVPLQGRGVAVEVTPWPGALDFGTSRLGDPPHSRLVTLGNTGTDFVTIQGAAVSGAAAESYHIEEDQCTGRLLWLTESCTLKIVFTPQRGGAAKAALDVASTAPLRQVDLLGYVVGEDLAVPTLGQWGLALLALLLALAGSAILMRRG